MVKTRATLGIAAVAVVWIAAWMAVLHAPPARESAVAIAAAVDFSVTASLALYLLAVRPGYLPRWTLGLTLATGLVFGKLVLATSEATTAVMAAGATFELGVIAWLAIRGRRAMRAWRVSRAAGAPTIDALTDAFLAAKLPARVAGAIATELTLVATLATGWRKPAPAFTVHRKSGWTLYAGVLIFLTLVETSVVHIALVTYASPTAAWIVTALSIYTALWFVGDALALRHGGAFVHRDALELRIGVRWRGRIPWRAIASLVDFDANRKDLTDISILGANLVIELREPVRLVGLLGRRRDATAIALSIDDREGFESAVRAAAGIERGEHRA